MHDDPFVLYPPFKNEGAALKPVKAWRRYDQVWLTEGYLRPSLTSGTSGTPSDLTTLRNASHESYDSVSTTVSTTETPSTRLHPLLSLSMAVTTPMEPPSPHGET